jgi:hypothetical protein
MLSLATFQWLQELTEMSQRFSVAGRALDDTMKK